MKKIKCIIFSLIILVGMAVMSYSDAYAASGRVSVGVSSSSTTVGGIISVTISISADEPIGYDILVNYDSSILQYQSGADSGGSQSVRIFGEGDGATTSFSRTISFKAIANGTSQISTSQSGEGLFGYDSLSALPTSYGGASVTVSPPATTAPTTIAPGNSTSSTEATTEAPTTADTYLKSLQISPGTLEPAFSSRNMSYTVKLPEETTSIIVSAAANNPQASVAVSHSDDLEPGANKTYIVVTAEDGSQRTYVLNVYCGEVEEDASEEEIEGIQIDGKPYTVASKEEMEGVEVPANYAEAEASYKNGKIEVYESANHLIQIAYLLDENGEGKWYIYQAEQEAFLPYLEYKSAENRYIILAAPANVQLPAGYTEITVSIQNQSVVAYSKSESDEFVLVYAVNLNGDAGLYVYDTIEGTFQRYVETEIVTEAITEASTEASTEEVTIDESLKLKRMRSLLYVVCGMMVALFATLIIMMIQMKKVEASKSNLPKSTASKSGLASKTMPEAEVETQTLEGLNHDSLGSEANDVFTEED